MKFLIKNPVVVWISKLIIATILELKYKDKKLKIGYGAYAKKTTFGNYNRLYDGVSLNNVSLGDFSYVAKGTKIANATIGKFCSIGPDCKVALSKHPTKDFVSTHPAFFSIVKRVNVTFADKNYFNEFEKISIGNDVWIGANSIVLDGVNIGDGAIIAAGSIVSKDIPPYAIAGGVPAKIIKYRFDNDEIEKLLNIKWWNMDIKFLKDNFKNFHNIKEFLNHEK